MSEQTVCYFELQGIHFEMGRQMAKLIDPAKVHFPVPPQYTAAYFEEAFQMYDAYYPGIREELEGFSQESGIPVREIAYSWMTYLVPRCCGLILTGKRMGDGHTRLARSYEFNLRDEDLTVFRTAPAGKYAHIGGSIAGFGRSEGINEKGLAVSMSSCGFPVSNMEGMRPPKVKGLEFWLVIRCLLENCANVSEALERVKQMPVSYNINLYLADHEGNAALFETIDGEWAFEQISPSDKRQSMCGTNHIVIKNFQSREPVAMQNSIIRYERLSAFTEAKELFEEMEIRDFLLKEYPEGMTAHYYSEGFGTIKSVVMDTVENRFSICWLGEAENGWKDYFVDQTQGNKVEGKQVTEENPTPEFFALHPIP